MAKHTVAALYGLIVLFGYVSYIMLEPFLSYIIMGALFGYIFYPVFKFLNKKLPSWVSGALVILLTLLVIVIPGVYIAGELIGQASGAFQMVQERGIFEQSSIIDTLQSMTGLDLKTELSSLLGELRDVIKKAIPSIITSTGLFIIGLFILLFMMYYSFKDGKKWFDAAVALIPVRKKQKARLKSELIEGTRALIYGHIVTSLIVGVVVGLILFLFGIPNVIFLSFLMIIFGILPFIGATFIYIPAAIILMWQGNWVAGISVLVLSGAAHAYIDYVLRPLLVSARSTIHPVLVIAGVFGGLLTMGIVGFLIGPLILNIFVTLLDFDYEAEEKRSS